MATREEVREGCTVIHLIMRAVRLRTILLLACLGALLCAGFVQEAAAAAERPAVDIIEVNGVLDPPLTNYLRDAITNANRDGAYLVVIEIDSAGALDVSLLDIASPQL